MTRSGGVFTPPSLPVFNPCPDAFSTVQSHDGAKVVLFRSGDALRRCSGVDATRDIAQIRVGIDGSVISATPGLNPSLTITALAERVMSFIPAKA